MYFNEYIKAVFITTLHIKKKLSITTQNTSKIPIISINLFYILKSPIFLQELSIKLNFPQFAIPFSIIIILSF